MLRRHLALAACTVLAWTAVARAEGPGVRLGDRLVLHPGVAAEFRWDSNIFFESANTANAFLFRLMPTLDLATRPSQRGGNVPHKIDFRLHAGLDYREWITSNQAINRHRMFGVQAGALLTILPHYPLSIDLFDNYVRTSQPPYTRGLDNIDRNTNEAGVRFRYRPGGGRLDFALSYAFGIDYFERYPLTELNVQYHRINFRTTWKFFPKTGIYLDVSESPHIYPTPGTTNHPNSFPLRVVAGLIGLITPKLTMNLWIGYGNGFYVRQPTDPRPAIPNPNTPIAGLELKWKPTALATGMLGYRHDFVNSLLGAFYDLDHAYIGWTQLIWRFAATADLRYSNIRYQGIPDSAAIFMNRRTDNWLAFDFRLDYHFKDWLSASVGYIMQYNNSDAMLNFSGGGMTPGMLLVPVNYLKHEVFLRLSVLY